MHGITAIVFCFFAIVQTLTTIHILKGIFIKQRRERLRVQGKECLTHKDAGIDFVGWN